MSDVLKQAVQALVMAGAGNVAAAVPKSKAGKIVELKPADMTLEQHDAHTQKFLDGACSQVQQDALETICVLAEDIRYTIESKRAAMVELVGVLFPSKKASVFNWERYSAMTGFLRSRSQYAYRELRRAMKTKFGSTPTAGKGSGKKPKYGAKTWYRGIASTLDTLAERFAKAPKDDIDVDAMREFTRAFRMIESANAKLAKRIAA